MRWIRTQKRTVALGIALCMCIPAEAGAARAHDDVDFIEASPDLGRVLFSTRAPLSDGDVDARCEDLYLRDGNQLHQVSGHATETDPCRDQDWAEVSLDLGTIAFTTRSSLAQVDSDARRDVYLWSGGELRPLIAASPRSMKVRGVSDDGSSVFFSTQDSLVADDVDASLDLYRWHDDSVDLITLGPASRRDGKQEPMLDRSGSVAYISSQSSLTADDQDAGCAGYGCAEDIYRWEGGALELVSGGPGGASASESDWAVTTPSGSTAYFETLARLTSDDQNEFSDVYEWSDGSVRRVTPDPIEANPWDSYRIWPGRDGAPVVVSTNAALVPADAGSAADIYSIDEQEVHLVSHTDLEPAENAVDLEWVAPETGTVIFSSEEGLVSADKGEIDDLYSWNPAEGEVELISGGLDRSWGFSDFQGADLTGERVVFDSNHNLLEADQDDDASDVYVGIDGGFELLSSRGLGPYEEAYTEATHRMRRAHRP